MAVALKDALAGKASRARCAITAAPAEESGSGKTFMARAGFFDDLDAAFCWHPNVVDEVQTASSLACIQARFCFTGRGASHAAVSLTWAVARSTRWS